MRRLLVVTTIALAAVGLVACSSSKESAGTDTSAAPTTSASGAGGANATTTGSEFCQQVGQIGQQYADTFKSVQQPPQFDPTNPQAALAQTQEIGRKLLEPMQQIQQVAPPEIKGDVDALVSGFQALASGSPEALASAGTQMGDAGKNFAQYLANNCGGTDMGGLGTGLGSSGSGSGSGTGTGTATATGSD